MSQIIIFSLMIMTLVSCGAPEETSQIGGHRRFEPISVSEEDYDRLKKVCQAIKNKESTLQQMVDNRVSFNFEYGEKSCEAKKIEAFNMYQLYIKNVAQDFEFVTKTGEEFGYRSVETSKVGLMVDVCNNLASKVSPIIAANGSAVWFGSTLGTKDCQSSEKATCIFVEYGKRVDGDNYFFHTRELIKFDIKGNREGFFTERKSVSSIGCAAGMQIERSATAK